MAVQSYRDLDVWKKAVAFVTDIYAATQGFPKEEVYALTSQIRRSSVSIPANISEGWGRKSTKSYIQFLSISQGSLHELETHLIISLNLKFLNSEQYTELDTKLKEIGRMLGGLINSLKTKLSVAP